MKSNTRVESVKWLSRYDGPNRRGGFYPRIETHYQTSIDTISKETDFGGGAPARHQNINSLAREVLRPRHNRGYVAESSLLAALAVISAWPIAMMIQAIIELLK